MKAYLDYKDSSFEFLGNIPSQWNVKRAKHVYSEVKDLSEDGSELLLSVSEYYGVKPRNQVIDDGEFITRADTLEGYKRCKSGDLIINIMLAWKKGLGVSDFNGIVSPAYAVFRPLDNIHSKYLHYLLRTNSYVSEFKRNSTGIMASRLRLYPDDFLRIPILLPSLSEQQAIADFLDRKTAQIDTLIEKKQRQIDLLQEQRTALINHAVTKGLNPDAPMKDSGMEWLGEIPSHWIVSKIRRVCSSVRDGTHAPPPRADGIHRLLSVRNIVDNEFITRDDDRTMTPEDFEVLQKSYTVEQGDVVLAIVGATTGKSAIVGKLDNVTVQRSLAVLRPSDKMESSFLNFWLKTAFVQNNIQRIMTIYSAQPGIYLDDLSNLRVLVPPIDEQSSITKWLLLQTKNIQESINRMQQQIELIQEYRTALISEAVTGKIDVRTAV